MLRSTKRSTNQLFLPQKLHVLSNIGSRELPQMANIGNMEDIRSLFKETIAGFMENGLEAEMDDELGYSKYDYKNKDTDNSRNGHSSKTLRTSFGEVEVSVPRDRKGEFEPRVLKRDIWPNLHA